jgi:hypothetical protein
MIEGLASLLLEMRRKQKVKKLENEKSLPYACTPYKDWSVVSGQP